MSPKLLRIATRKSPLALWQAQYIANSLLQHHPKLQIELVTMTTSGDRFLKDKLLTIGGKGLFVKELEDALLKHQADLAVHSMKDVPNIFPSGLMIAAISLRENPYDALISRKYASLKDLPLHATIGTSSLRRQSQLLAIRPDLRIISLRGNIHTRLEKLDTDAYDAIVLAVAGLKRMNLEHLINETISETIMLPACGQGALGLECRTEDIWVRSLLEPLNDKLTASCVQAERHVNALLGGNCHVPLAVYAQCVPSSEMNLLSKPTEESLRRREQKTMVLQAKVASIDGHTVLATKQIGPMDQTESLANRCAEHLIAQGAKKLLHIDPI